MYQNTTIVGNLGSDPEMRYTPSGQAVTNFSVATNRTWTDASGNKVEEVTWFRVSVWGKSAEASNQYLKVGNRVLVVGRLTPDKDTGNPRLWTRKDGTTAASFEITANLVKFLTPKSEGGDYTPPNDNDAQFVGAGGGAQADPDEVPF